MSELDEMRKRLLELREEVTAKATEISRKAIEALAKRGYDVRVATHARRLPRKSPKTGKARSQRAIAAELVELGYVGPSGQPYHPGSIAHMPGR
jgi:hypothetical protein